MPAPSSELTYTRAHAHRRRRATGRGPALLLGGLLLVGLLGYGGFRLGTAEWHRLHNGESAASHQVNTAQLGRLHQVPGGYSDDAGFQHTLSTGVAASPPPIPADAVLSVPYTVQAPFGNWKLHEESCEEAALLMYHDFLAGDQRSDIPAAEADPALRALKAWQVQNWGVEKDLSIDRTGQLAQAYWGYHYHLVDATAANIRQAIADGHPVVVPVMTHSLQNPHYGPNTVYHEVLLKGYNAAGVVANDAGVQEGKNWFYSWSVLFGAIDAQTAKMNQGRVALVLTTT